MVKKKWKQLTVAAGLALCFGLAVKADTQAASQVTGLKQTGDSSSRIDVQCDAVLGADRYYLELSTDKNNWVVVDTSSGTSLSGYSLSSGASYYARVGLCTDWDGNDKVAGTVSEPIEVVTAPNDNNMEAVQTDAKTTGFSVKSSAVAGANYYQLYYDKTKLGESASSTVTSKVKLNAGQTYWCHLYSYRKSASGYLAEGSYDYVSLKTLAPAVNTRSFGIVYDYVSGNSYRFSVSMPYKKDGIQFQFSTPAGKVKKSVMTTGDSTYVDNFINGNFYKYRVRSYVVCGAKNVYSAWSGYKYIGVPKKTSFKMSKNRKSLNISIGKVNDATSYTVYSSTKEKSGFKKVKTVSAKKRSLSVTKVGGKKLKKNTKYYFRVVPNAKIGGKTIASQNNVTYVYSYTYY